MQARSLNYRRGRSGRPLQRAKDRVYAEETHCCRCGQPVDKTLPYRDPVTGEVNPESKSFDHLTELDLESDPYDGHLAHLRCNASAGARYVNAKRSGPTEEALTAGIDDSLL